MMAVHTPPRRRGPFPVGQPPMAAFRPPLVERRSARPRSSGRGCLDLPTPAAAATPHRNPPPALAAPGTVRDAAAACAARPGNSSPSRYAINSSGSNTCFAISNLVPRNQLLLERRGRAKQPRPHRVHRYSQQLGDLGVAQLLVLPQHQNFAIRGSRRPIASRTHNASSVELPAHPGDARRSLAAFRLLSRPISMRLHKVSPHQRARLIALGARESLPGRSPASGRRRDRLTSSLRRKNPTQRRLIARE